MIRRADDIKGLAAQLDAQPFSNIYALAALAGYPADDRFYRAYAAGPGALDVYKRQNTICSSWPGMSGW